MQARRQTFGQIDGGCHVTSGDYRCFAQRHGRARRQAENVSHEVDAVAVASGEALRDAGFEVLHVGTASAAIADLVARQDIHLVFADIDIDS